MENTKTIETTGKMKKINEFCKENQATIEVAATVIGTVANVALGVVIAKGSIGAVNKIASKTIGALITRL